jgi:hypothetical protein
MRDCAGIAATARRSPASRGSSSLSSSQVLNRHRGTAASLTASTGGNDSLADDAISERS